MIKALFAATIFCSSFLLFLVQPLISKQILPWFGGSAAVWSTCLVFFQVMLLAGYAYADRLSRLAPRWQGGIHGALLAASLAGLPIVAAAGWKPDAASDPALRILLLLGATIGLPYLTLAATGPLLQSWVSRTLDDTRVYRFFSLSNLASLLALVAYPFVIEPHAPLLLQAHAWSAVYAVFALLCLLAAAYFMRHAKPAPIPEVAAAEPAPAPAAGTQLLWLGLAAMGTWLLLAVTNHITQNIAAVPFLWLLPLTLYLLSFILCFESDRWYARSRFLLPTALALAVCAYGLQRPAVSIDIKVAIPVYAGSLFLFCMFLHGELARLRPAPRYLTRFYLMLALGGALGGIAVGLLAPLVLPGNFELGLGLAAAALLAVAVLRRQAQGSARRWLPAGAAALALAAGYGVYREVAATTEGVHYMARSFYGSLRTVDEPDDETNQRQRLLFNGAIQHGEQYLDPPLRREPTAYYGHRSGIGLVLDRTAGVRAPRRTGVIGLGAGTLAAYGQPGDVMRFYELNPHVLDIARREFSFLHDSRAQIETVLGDARLALEREAPQGFDVLAIDAFSGDSIPVHLITREALDVYLRHMKPDGIIAFHVTNRFLALAPVVAQLAGERGLRALLVSDDGDTPAGYPTDWVLVARDAEILDRIGLLQAESPIEPIPGLVAWSDDFNNLFDVLK